MVFETSLGARPTRRQRLLNGWLFGAGVDVRRHVLDGAAHRARLHRRRHDLRRWPRPRGTRGAGRHVAGDRPAGRPHARRDRQVLVPVRWRPAGEHGDRTGGWPADRHRPASAASSSSRGSCSSSASRSPGRRRSRAHGWSAAGARRPAGAPHGVIALAAIVVVIVLAAVAPKGRRPESTYHGRRRAGGRRAGDHEPRTCRRGSSLERHLEATRTIEPDHEPRHRAVARERHRRQRRAVRGQRRPSTRSRPRRPGWAFRSRSA